MLLHVSCMPLKHALVSGTDGIIFEEMLLHCALWLLAVTDSPWGQENWARSDVYQKLIVKLHELIHKRVPLWAYVP